MEVILNEGIPTGSFQVRFRNHFRLFPDKDQCKFIRCLLVIPACVSLLFNFEKQPGDYAGNMYVIPRVSVSNCIRDKGWDRFQRKTLLFSYGTFFVIMLIIIFFHKICPGDFSETIRPISKIFSGMIGIYLKFIPY